MKSIKLYKVLQNHAAVINSLALDVYNERKETDEVLAEVKAEVERVSSQLNEDRKA